MVLIANIGNTNINVAVFDNDDLVWKLSIPVRDEISEETLLARLCDSHCPVDGVDYIAIGSVVPLVTERVKNALQSLTGTRAIQITARMAHTISIPPRSLDIIGIDLVANAAAAYCQVRDAVIVVDFGTALTMIAANRDGAVQGVTIAPSPFLMLQSLSEGTAQIPAITGQFPRRYLGQDTPEAVRSGVFFGYCGMVKQLIAGIKEEIQSPAQVIATGGGASLFAPNIAEIGGIEPLLTLRGLRDIADEHMRSSE